MSVSALPLNPAGSSPRSEATVPFQDLGALHAPLQAEIAEQIAELAATSDFVNGAPVRAFEHNFADYCGARYGIGCNSGTSAIHLALLAAGVGPGDEVITIAHTFVGTVWGILYCGATPVFVDIDPQTMTMAPESIEAHVTTRTKAIVPVHLYGHPVDMDAVVTIAQRHNLFVIEDAAQAHGASYKGRPVGSLGHMACFSFYPGKNLGAWGEGGMVVTSDPALRTRMTRLRDHGQARRYLHADLGFNYRMDSIQAAVLDIKLAHLDEWNRARRRACSWYEQALAGTADVTLPVSRNWALPVHHLYVIQHPHRDELRAYLAQAGIETGLHYPVPLHRQAALCGRIEKPLHLPVTDRVASQCLSLPMHPNMSRAQVEYLAETMKRFDGRSQ